MSSDESSTRPEPKPEDLLPFDTAFSPVDVPVQPFNPPITSAPAPAGNPADEASSAPNLDPVTDSWREEYDARVKTWQAESADRRGKAEAERAKWEELRAAGHEPERDWVEAKSDTEAERSTAANAPKAASGSEAHGSVTNEDSPVVTSVADARDLVSGEKNGGRGAEVLGSTLGYPAFVRTPEISDIEASLVNLSGVDDVHSLGSSFPSLPEQHISFQPTLKPRIGTYNKEKKHHHRTSHQPTAPAVPPSLTLSIFDSSLPTRTRVIALFSSLAINMFLPFVNGVMLGFGEIFARNVVGPWLGWPKPVATSVGVRAGRDNRRS